MGIIYDQGQAPWDDGTANSATKSMFGDMDITANVNAGNSYSDMLAWYEANPSQQGGGGIGGGVHQKLVAGAAAEKNKSGGGGGGYNSGGGGGGQQMAGSQQFQNNLNEATQAYRPEEVNMDDFKYGSGKYDHLGKDFNDQVQKEQLIKETDPFGDSWNSIDFFGKHITMGREAQKGRSDASGIANKYIFNAAQSNPVDIAALDKQIRSNPLYSESKAELGKLNTYGDTYANSSQNPVNWVQPQDPSAYQSPDFDAMYNKTTKDINKIKI
jgi:hypothetical protein